MIPKICNSFYSLQVKTISKILNTFLKIKSKTKQPVLAWRNDILILSHSEFLHFYIFSTQTSLTSYTFAPWHCWHFGILVFWQPDLTWLNMKNKMDENQTNAPNFPYFPNARWRISLLGQRNKYFPIFN